MTTIPDSELLSEAERVQGKVVLVTGAASGFGRASAILFARYGAKLVIADRDTKGAEKVVDEIQKLGSQAILHTCDVTSWEQQVQLFQTTVEKYGAVDVVVANAGVIEAGIYVPVQLDAKNVPIKPDLTTIDVNLIGVLYTACLAQYYLLLDHQPEALKSLILIGSVASFEGIPLGVLYSTSKHALLGLHKSLFHMYNDRIRIATVCPWFSDTAILITPVKLFLAGLPLVPVQRVAATIVKAVTDSPDTNGAVYTLPDGGEAFRLNREHFALDTGVYKLLRERAESFLVGFNKTYLYISTVIDLVKIGGFKLLIAVSLPLVLWGWTNGAIPSVLKHIQNTLSI